MKRLTFWNTLSCCSVLWRRDSSSLLLGMRFHYSDALTGGRRLIETTQRRLPIPSLWGVSFIGFSCCNNGIRYSETWAPKGHDSRSYRKIIFRQLIHEYSG